MVWSAGAVVTAAQLNANAPQEWTTWTPTITSASGAYTTTTVGLARYCRHGDTIVWQLHVTITAVGTASGALRFTLPVTAQSASGYIGGGRENAATGVMLQAVLVGTTIGNAYVFDNSTASFNANGRVLILGGVYEAA